jgi:glycosidase
MIYYGTEAGMWGADDPCDRMPMVWQELSYEPQRTNPSGTAREPDAVAFDESLFNFYRAAIGLRRESAALRRGEIEFVAADDRAKFLGFRRSADGETLLIGINRGDAAYPWKVSLAEGESASQIFTASGDVEAASVDAGEGEAIVSVPAIDGVVLRLSPKE